jgi:anti-sigma factor RsiW
MRHLNEVELLGLLYDELDGDDRESRRAHLSACPDCASAYDRLGRAIALLEREPLEPAPAFAWPRLKDRVDRSSGEHDWDEPHWAPLILRNVAGIVIAILLMFLTAGWLARPAVWESIQSWPLAHNLGPLNLTVLFFFGAGALVALALAPVLWWETRRPRNGIVK